MEAYYKSKKNSARIKVSLSYVILTIIAVVFIFPFIWMLSTAFKIPSEAYTLPPKIIPETFTWDNFIQGWQYADFTRYTWNTLIVTGLATIGTVLSASFVAYGFARFKSRYSGLLFTVVLATMMLPSQVTLVPTYLLFTKLGWLDTLMPLIVPSFLGEVRLTFSCCGNSSKRFRKIWMKPHISTVPMHFRFITKYCCLQSNRL
ncbi:carbohydrate ABC transporter permease [Paenibacillus sp. CC-CFT742]|nr:carbohydrate ABC transporter permease [Paenibacillus sp. CC-CFT742]WJH32168.1 carbohydrate ABC transporter permease [Paenibacillus sp. CC-CFT742]